MLQQFGVDPLWRFVVYPLILLLVMLLRPQGLFGSTEIGFLKARVWPKWLGARAASADAGNGSEQHASATD